MTSVGIPQSASAAVGGVGNPRELTGADSVALLVVARLGAEVVDVGGSEDVEPESGTRVSERGTCCPCGACARSEKIVRVLTRDRGRQ